MYRQQRTENSLVDVIPVDAVMLVFSLSELREVVTILWHIVQEVFLYLTKELSYCTWSASPCVPCVITLMSVFCVHLVTYQQLGLPGARSRTGQAVQSVMAGGTARPSHYKSSLPLPSPPARQGRTPCRVNSLRPSTSVYLTHCGEYPDGCALVVGCDQRVVA